MVNACLCLIRTNESLERICPTPLVLHVGFEQFNTDVDVLVNHCDFSESKVPESSSSKRSNGIAKPQACG
jgi:hypothetical protein